MNTPTASSHISLEVFGFRFRIYLLGFLTDFTLSTTTYLRRATQFSTQLLRQKSSVSMFSPHHVIIIMLLHNTSAVDLRVGLAAGRFGST
jgi:hypothetical protein